MTITIKPNYFIIPGIVSAVLFLSQYFMSHNIDWYYSLSFPFFAPPKWLFSPAWLTIYALCIIVFLYIWNSAERNMRFWMTISLFIVNLALNGYWTYLFFAQHKIGYAAIDAGLLAISVLLLMRLIEPTSPFSAWALLPYLIWSSFATLLNVFFWLLN